MRKTRGRPINPTCQACAELTIDAAKALHGPDGDNCWNAATCHRRRSHYRNRWDINKIRRDRRTQHKKQQSPAVADAGSDAGVEPSLLASSESFALPLPSPALSAVLVIYGEGLNKPVHAVGVELWLGEKRIHTIAPVHCMGMLKPQFDQYIRTLAEQIYEQFRIPRFEPDIKFLSPYNCPIVPCPHQL